MLAAYGPEAKGSDRYASGDDDLGQLGQGLFSALAGGSTTAPAPAR